MSSDRADMFRTLLEKSCGIAVSHLDQVFERDARSLEPTEEAVRALANHMPIPRDLDPSGSASASGRLKEEGCSEEQVLAEIQDICSPAAVHSNGPRYFGFVTGGVLPVAIAADWIVPAFDHNSWNSKTSALMTHVEMVTIQHLRDLVFGGLDSEQLHDGGVSFPPSPTKQRTSWGGTLVGGCTAASIAALAAGRDAILQRAGWNVVENGLLGAPAITIYVSDDIHSSVLKSLRVVGLPSSPTSKHLVKLPTNKHGAVVFSREHFPESPSGPALVLLQAGNVNTGAFDDFDNIIQWAKSSQGPVWVHIDGAFGLFAGASDEHRHFLKGAEKADSWAVDLHKMLQVPYDSAAVFVKDAATMRDTFTAVAPYAAAAASGGGPGDAGVSQQVELVPELQNSRRGRALVAYATLKHLGKNGVSALVKDLCRRARLFASQLSYESRAGPEVPVEVVNEVVFNQVLVSFGRAEDTLAICEAVRKSGNCWVAATRWKDRTAMRLSVTNWATTDQDIEISAKEIIECARKVIFQ